MTEDVPAPLQGCRIAVTRADQQLGGARQLFEAAGAEVVDLPALVVEPPEDWRPLDEALADLDQFHWLLFSTANGVEAVQARLRRRGGDLARPPKGLRIAAVGRRTAEQLEEMGVAVDFVPSRFVADALIDVDERRAAASADDEQVEARRRNLADAEQVEADIEAGLIAGDEV